MWLLHFYIRIIATIVQRFFIFYDDPGQNLYPRQIADIVTEPWYIISIKKALKC